MLTRSLPISWRSYVARRACLQRLLYGSSAIGTAVSVIPDVPPSPAPGEFAFFGEARLEYGVDRTVDAELTDWMKVRGTFGYVDGKLEDGTQVPLLPPIKLAGEVTFHQDQLGMLDSAYLTIGARYAAVLIEPFGLFDLHPPDGPPFGTASTGAYTLFDVSLGGTIAPTGTELEIAATNVFDTEHRDFRDTYINITLGPGCNIIPCVTQPF